VKRAAATGPGYGRAALLLALLLCGCLHAPRPLEIPPREDPARWAPDIEAFARQDREAPAQPGAVVFVGSSSIRLWSTLAADMAPVPVLNRGFGGLKLFDAVYYADQLVGVHLPSLVVVFSGSNDVAGGDAKSPEQVRDLFRQFVARLRSADERLTIAYIAITPTLAREEHSAAVREANRLIHLDCEADPRLEFIDPRPDLMDAVGRPDPQWFREDRLHLNERGYATWTRHTRPVVQRLYERERLHSRP
jgi:lysophospholipase L1-like esterase